MKKSTGRIYFILFVLLGLGWWMVKPALTKTYRQTVYRLANNKLELITFEPEQDFVYKVVFDGDIWINTAAGKGEWMINSLPKLAANHGKTWLDRTIGETLANGLAISYEDLNWGDKFVIWKKSRSVDSRVWEGKFWEEKKALDGQNLKYLSKNWLTVKKEIFLDTKLAAEDFYITVENASGIPGVGNIAADSIDLAGGHVFDVVKSETVLVNSCQLSVNNKFIKSQLVNWLIDRFDCEVVDGNEDIVVVKIGREFGETVIDLL